VGRNHSWHRIIAARLVWIFNSLQWLRVVVVGTR
jgi:hypothetical protein